MKVKKSRKVGKTKELKENIIDSDLYVNPEDDYNHDSDLDDKSNFMKEFDENNEFGRELNGINNSISSTRKKRSVTEELGNVPIKKKKLQNDLYKQPTVEELSQLRETETLFHSNLFRLQIEELLAEVKLKNKYKKLFDLWFIKFKANIESLQETDELKFADGNINKKLHLNIPILNVPEDVRGTFKFLKPLTINIIGSYSFDCTIGQDSAVDVMIQMPDNLFQKHDYQNYRYLRKKAIYLAYITSNIGDDLADKKSFIGSNLQPVLKIVPPGSLGKKLSIHIHISAHENSFKLNRFSPEKNSIRPNWFFNEEVTSGSLTPTPHYNSIILHDLTMSETNSQNTTLIKEYPNIRDGIILLKIWLSQRQLIKGYDSFSSHIMTMYVLYLLKIKKLNTFMSSYQIVRNVWCNLVQINWYENGISMYQEDNNQQRILDYHKYYDCVFLDSSGYHNLASFLSRNTFSWVQREAEISLKHLDNVNVNSFPSIFMHRVPFYNAFDNILCIEDDEAIEKIVDAKSSRDDKLDYGVDKRSQAIKILIKVLQQGLGNRVHRICVLPNESMQWDCENKLSNNIGKISIGFDLNPEFCFSIVEKGPEANLPDAALFRKFWCNKSELRRFQDGSIREAVIWGKGKTLHGKRMICKKIVKFILKHKFNLSENQYLYLANQMEDILKLNKIKITHFAYGTGEEATLRVVKAFNSLEKDLMSLVDIPLSITGVQGSSAAFRYTEVFPPLSTVYRAGHKITKEGENYLMLKTKNIGMVPRYVYPLDVSLQLSTSGKWPEELEAIRKTKAAFHIQIAECLRKQHNLKAQGNVAHIDVFKDGFVFRLRIAHQKEIAFLKHQVDEDGVIKYRDNEESIELEKKLFQLPKLNGALHGIHSQHPSFGAACCLTKRWLSAHLLDDHHMPNVAVELILASMYLMPEPYRHAHMPQVGFLRVLEIFAREYWNTDPVIVNFNDEMSKEEIIEVETLFGKSRDTLPPLFISTPYDQQGSLWTRKAPTVLILNRICLLAQESLKLFEQQLYTKMILDCKSLFRSPISEYDCLIHLKPLLNPRRLQAIDLNEEHPVVEWHPYKPHSLEKIPVIDFDPIQYFLKELRDGYSEFALFFHDTYGGMVIGVLLKPTALKDNDFKVSNMNCRKLNNDGKLVLNFSTMIQDFYVLGKDLVRAIEVISNKLSLT
ncbi:nucleolar protein 6 [Vespa crabro]|uniref:nucleolar protein 6 n=1 Tax=Vespa crabro TaxID=7445 RepID=UPI001F003FB5|nr:nucleolar protein 6 [Vespa crabro]